MADQSIIHSGENTQEQIAYKLFLHVVHADGKRLGGGTLAATIDRKDILDTYAECLQTAKGRRLFQSD
ncbi:hypothetical protein [Rhodopila sp.]|uniref:hypothetical protein n=1 Tax=Rhodopila sp. TaxID=2480087 RepID=UPI003D0C4BD5